MNPKTVEALREAAINALQACEDVAAAELLSLMNGSTAQFPEIPPADTLPSLPKALPQGREVEKGPPHDYHYWMRFIREQFIPFMTSNGRLRFTSHELLTWLENCRDLTLTTGDLEDSRSDGRAAWRSVVTVALGNLKQQGVIVAPAFAKEYLIQLNISVTA